MVPTIMETGSSLQEHGIKSGSIKKKYNGVTILVDGASRKDVSSVVSHMRPGNISFYLSIYLHAV
ncbi:hypothetical protein DY000_02013050 [Brassica cretica]|uniref:Uncharacterized protein n=1 Tax=Brassica cretica TaxID=69181 RepID=A0ABQ7CVM2_BRACR|nr:hypothetical protein DY000_02013050 [Brassica cretica]